jgi:peptide/nickel transport system substrate-binding protein
LLAANKDLKVETLNKLGFQTLGRMNFLYPPLDNVKVRRAAFMAMNKDVLDATVGNPKYYRICGAVFVCGTPLATNGGAERTSSSSTNRATIASSLNSRDWKYR